MGKKRSGIVIGGKLNLRKQPTTQSKRKCQIPLRQKTPSKRRTGSLLHGSLLQGLVMFSRFHIRRFYQ